MSSKFLLFLRQSLRPSDESILGLPDEMAIMEYYMIAI